MPLKKADTFDANIGFRHNFTDTFTFSVVLFRRDY